ncbi:hypothetical protein EDC48_102398 [Gibbsiella quercinecans]|uniref:Uncharacterized protein n=1 Tax=Gibbsiella quercinecans TaxID=929813 RepID=A0A250AXC9_9GAMM|nr:hypothetical protein [Gibbsiella quercinecans]ATA18623.1 hypothetical protein AWC35_04270 [Gibbsiella quercinecans]RLM14871.1 hypothetical protein BIY30_00030 [Gibbsiella quercinecans]TCT91861.1 hypothetical protein EDC48_102398 [Gibbsiella quercinecans]
MKFISIKIGIKKNRYVHLDAYSSLIIFILIIMAMVCFSMFKEKIMPAYFFFDQVTIGEMMKYTHQFSIGNSYGSTAYFYRLLGVEPQSILFSLVSSLLIMITYLFMLSKVRGGHLNIADAAVFLFFCFVSIINMTWLSKDFIVFLVMSPLLIAFYNKKIGFTLWTVAALVYACYFRTYWFLFLLEFMGLFIASRFVKKSKSIFIVCLLSLLFLAIAFQYGLGMEVDFFRTSVNEGRLDNNNSGYNTIITPWVGTGNPILGWINVTITWISFYIPFPLILLFSPYYLLISGFIILMFYRIWQNIGVLLRSDNNSLQLILSLLVISFTVVQSIFEPDYGSYVRHLAPFYPIMFYTYLSCQRKGG